MKKIKSPYPYCGGKSRVADIILKAFGGIQNYIEPFAGSLAVLLANTKIPKIETVNDINCALCNFWRSVAFDPKTTAQYADYPVIENELHARHRYIIENITDDFKKKMDTDPSFYDPKIAGYWVYGISASIGNNWLNQKGLKAAPLLSSAGGGINGLKYDVQENFKKLQERLKRVRVCCGDWTRIISPSITYNNKSLSKNDITAVFLDPPYSLENRDKVYQDETNVYNDVCNWAINNSNIPSMRIAVCGFDGDYTFPNTWQTYKWKTNGGLANLGNDRGKDNSSREIIYFSPNCFSIE